MSHKIIHFYADSNRKIKYTSSEREGFGRAPGGAVEIAVLDSDISSDESRWNGTDNIST